MEKMPKTLGIRVKAARERLGWSQAELARQLGASAYGVNLLENGGTPYPRADRVYALAKLLGVTTDYLLGLEETAEDSEGEPAAVA